MRAGAVHPDEARLDAACRAVRIGEARRPHRAGQAVLDRIDLLEQGFLVLPLEHRQHRAEYFLVRDAHFLGNVGKHGRLDKEPTGELRVVGPLAATSERRAFLLADLDVGEDFLHLRFRDDGAHGGVHLGGNARFVVPDVFHHAIEDAVVHRLVYEQPRGRAARLPAPTEVHSAHGAFRRLLQVGVREDDAGVLAAQFKRDVLEALGGGARDRAPGGDAADQRHARHQRVRDQRLAARDAAGENVQHARRQDAVDDLQEAVGGKRRLVRRLHDHGVAGRNGGRSLGRGKHDGMVIGDDARANAERLAHRQVHHAVAHRDGLALHFGHEPREVIPLRRRRAGIPHHLAHRVAAVGGVQHGQFLGVGAQLRRDLFHQGGALERLHRAPRPVGPVRRLDRSVHVLCIGFRAGTQASARRGIQRVLVPAPGLLPLAVVIQVPVPGQDGVDAVAGSDGLFDLVHGLTSGMHGAADFGSECIIQAVG